MADIQDKPDENEHNHLVTEDSHKLQEGKSDHDSDNHEIEMHDMKHEVKEEIKEGHEPLPIAHKVSSEAASRSQNNMKKFDVYEAYFDSSLDVVSDLSHELIHKPAEEGDASTPPVVTTDSKFSLLLSFLWSILWILLIACTKFSVNKLGNTIFFFAFPL